MGSQATGWSLGELAQLFRGELLGSEDQRVFRAVPCNENEPKGLAFAESDAYLRIAANSTVGAVLVPKGAVIEGKAVIQVDAPRVAFARFLHMVSKPLSISPGIHPTAVIAETAKVSQSAKIGPFVVIGEGSVIDDDAVIHAHCFIGDSCKVGKAACLYPRVTLIQEVEIGDRTILHSGVVVGADGFGYYWDGSQHQKIPQVGRVRIGNDVEIGANTCIDRATSGVTQVGSGTKLDDLCMIGHNVSLGDHVVLAAQAGIAGSASIESGVIAGGQIALKDGAKVSSGVVLAGRTGVTQDLTEPGEYFGLPAVPLRDAMRQIAAARQLPELIKKVRNLEKVLQSLQEGEK